VNLESYLSPNLDPNSKELNQELDYSELVPEDMRNELLTLRAVENRSSWRTGDIVLTLIARAKELHPDVTMGQVCEAVAYYRGLNGRRVYNITLVCRAFPPENRRFEMPYSDYEIMHFSLPKEKHEEAVLLAKRMELESGSKPRMTDTVRIVNGEEIDVPQRGNIRRGYSALRDFITEIALSQIPEEKKNRLSVLLLEISEIISTCP
jgi:hypothetical protein